MSKRIVYSNDDGSVSIVIPVDKSMSIEEIAIKDVPNRKTYHIIEASELPDMIDRDAFKIVSGKVVICEIMKQEIDNKREFLLNKKKSIISKLGITEEEASELRNLL